MIMTEQDEEITTPLNTPAGGVQLMSVTVSFLQECDQLLLILCSSSRPSYCLKTFNTPKRDI